MNVKDLLLDKNIKVVANWMGWFKKNGGKHIAGVCESQDPRTIRAQIKMAKAVGIDGFVVDWGGFNPDFSENTNQATLELMVACEEEGFEFSIMVDSSTFKWPQVTDKNKQLNDALTYVIATYTGSSVYSKIGGKPLLWEFTWRENGIDPAAIAPLYPGVELLCQNKTPTGASFAWVNGFAPSTPEAYLSNYLKATDRIMVPCVFYQFDDHDVNNPANSVWGGPARFISAKYGQTWTNCFNLINTIKVGTFNYIQICTWNDYEERTNIEPIVKAITGTQLF